MPAHLRSKPTPPVDKSNENAGGVLAKVKADIGFLQERIDLMLSHGKPNTAVLQTYQTMLARREIVLASLLKKQGTVEASAV